MDTTLPFRDEVLTSLLTLFITSMTTSIQFGFQLIQVIIQAVLVNNGLSPFGGGLGLGGS